jgi:hypothetical protein
MGAKTKPAGTPELMLLLVNTKNKFARFGPGNADSAKTNHQGEKIGRINPYPLLKVEGKR